MALKKKEENAPSSVFAIDDPEVYMSTLEGKPAYVFFGRVSGHAPGARGRAGGGEGGADTPRNSSSR